MDINSKNIISLNISEIDSELLKIEEQIRYLQTQREELQLVRRYAMSKASRVNNSIPPIAQKMSDFILMDLRGGPADGGEILKRYALALGVEIDKPLSNRFGNTLFRLKDDGLIDGKAKGASRRLGTEYSITEKGLEILQPK